MPRTAKDGGAGAVDSGARRTPSVRRVEIEEHGVQIEDLANLAAEVATKGPHNLIASYGLLRLLSILAIATILLGRLIPPLGDALHQVAQFLVR